MKKILFSIALLAIIGAGCSVNSGSAPTISSAKTTYQVEITKSPTFKNTLSLTAKDTTSIEELMLQAGDKFTSQFNATNNETVTQLDGVIATASKEWNLYINNQKINFTNLNKVTAKSGDKVEWKYELTK